MATGDGFGGDTRAIAGRRGGLWRRARLRVGWVALLAALGAVVAVAAQAQGAIYLSETFTGATADPLFSAYGAACLTGAPAGTLSPGEHPLGGCADTNVVNSPPRNAAPLGFLQLTDASNDQSGAVLFDTPIPAEQGLTVVFEQWQYGTTTANPAPADGIAFFLADGQAQLTAPGAFGGSLGYAQKRPDGLPANPIIPGVDRGYLGIGLDVLGNYFGDWEDRSLGCPAGQRSPAGTAFRVPERDKITVRGPGDPNDPTLGYCFLTSTAQNLGTPGATSWPSNLPVTLQGATTSFPPGVTPQQAQDILEPDRRTIEVTITPAPNPVVTVAITAADGVRHAVLSFQAPQPVPETYKFGFSASTGAFTDVHLIRNVVLESVVPSPILELTKSADTAGPVEVGDIVTYTYEVVNTGLAPVSTLTVVDDKIPGVECDSSTLAAVDDAPANATVCRGQYEVTSADAVAGQITNTATAAGDDGGAISPPDDVTLTVSPLPPAPGPSPSPTQVPPEDPGAAAGGLVHVLPATGTNGLQQAALALSLLVGGVGLLVLARHLHRARPRP